ncbi:MAG: hypothetical protein H0U52_16195 [Chloroflexi bacterium]|nr:hypothetical protein [Chloroflexota bacterium]
MADRTMPLDQLLDWAREAAADDAACRAKNGTPWYDDARVGRLLAREPILARGMIDLLGESQPCTLEAPVVHPGTVAIMDGETPLYEFSPGEARAYAAMLLRAADEAEGPS